MGLKSTFAFEELTDFLLWLWTLAGNFLNEILFETCHFGNGIAAHTNHKPIPLHTHTHRRKKAQIQWAHSIRKHTHTHTHMWIATHSHTHTRGKKKRAFVTTSSLRAAAYLDVAAAQVCVIIVHVCVCRWCERECEFRRSYMCAVISRVVRAPTISC